MFRYSKEDVGVSPGKIAWQKLKANYSAMASLLWISFTIIIATSGYLITPDSTPFANAQYLELATQSPGTSILFLTVKKNTDTRHKRGLSKMMYGSENPFDLLPIVSYRFEDDQIMLSKYTGYEGFEGMEVPVHIANVAFNIDSAETQNGFIKLFLRDGRKELWSIDDIQELIENKHLITKRFLLGTDRFGRDILSQIIIGARVSMSVGFIAITIALLLGLILGSLGGFFRGRIDTFIVWLINVIWSIPTLLLVIAITFALGKGFWQIFIAVGLTMWVDVARIVRGQIITLRENEYIEAAKALGIPGFRIITRHLLPNITGPVVVISAANFASAILIEAGLSFLGIGVQPPMPSWGSMIRENYGYIILDKAYMAIIPGLCIMFLVMAFMLLGNGLRQAIDKSPANY